MTEEQKQSILDSAKVYFREAIIPGHIKKITKIKLKDFKINPFTINYTAAFLCGNTKPESIAKALIYPQILGTSIISSNYKKLAEDYPVFCGSDFWKRLTGDSEFYYRLAKAFGEVVEEDKINGSKLIKDAITRIAKEIEKKGII